MTARELNDFLYGAFPAAPRPHEVTAVTEAGVTLRLFIGAEHERPGGTVSGPAMMGLADAAAWMATLSRIGPVALAGPSFEAMLCLGGRCRGDKDLREAVGFYRPGPDLIGRRR